MAKISEPDKMKMISLVKKGLENEDIRKIFSNQYTRQQVAAIQAWVTMGKY